MTTYTRRLMKLVDGSEVEHIRTKRGGRESWDETTYLVEETAGHRKRIAKSEVVEERRVRMKVTT